MMRESKTRKLGHRACRKESGTRIVRVERGGEGVRAKVRLGVSRVFTTKKLIFVEWIQ